MTLTFYPCQPSHLKMIEPQERDRLKQSLYLMPQNLHYITEHFCMSAWHNNRCVGVAGVLELEDGNGLAWALLSKNAGPYMRGITRAVKKALDILPYPTVYMTCYKGFEEANRWAKMLGFRAERHPAIDEDRLLYVRGT